MSHPMEGMLESSIINLNDTSDTYGLFNLSTLFILLLCDLDIIFRHDQGSIGTCLVIWIHEPIIRMWF
jgi:hypothetical protein